MRKLLLFTMAFLVVAQRVSAQETYSLAATAQQVTDLTSQVTTSNEQTCNRLGQALTCTQAQACTAANAPGGASCTAAQARSVNARIFPLTQAGREEFVTFRFAAKPFSAAKGQAAAWFQFKQCFIVWPTANQTTRDGMCTAAGFSAGCPLCPGP